MAGFSDGSNMPRPDLSVDELWTLVMLKQQAIAELGSQMAEMRGLLERFSLAWQVDEQGAVRILYNGLPKLIEQTRALLAKEG